MANHSGLTQRVAASFAACAMALCLSACTSFDEDELRRAFLLPLGRLPSLWIPNAATQEQCEHAVRFFRQNELQNQPPARFWARLAYSHETKLQREKVKHIAVRVPAVGKAPAGRMLVDIHSGRPINRVYEMRSKPIRQGRYVMIGSQKALVFNPSGNQVREGH